MTIKTEREMASQVGGRLPGLDATPSSHAMLGSLTGADTTIGFEDYLNVKACRPVAPRVVLHDAMEARMGL